MVWKHLRTTEIFPFLHLVMGDLSAVIPTTHAAAEGPERGELEEEGQKGTTGSDPHKGQHARTQFGLDVQVSAIGTEYALED